MQPLAPIPFQSLFSDSSIALPKDDEFNRYPFAQRIAATIRARQDAASLVLSLYGKWGSGKTSVLNFIRHELLGSEVITMVFNPWLFSGEEQLLRGFFAEFGEKLAPLGELAARAATTALSEYSKKIAARAGALRQDATEAHAQAFEASAALEGLQQQLRETLRGAGKRILVLIDDIDRLDKHEVQALLRLVKLTADFPYTTYLLAFDDAIVAHALSERYPGGGKAAGKRFLEKIIQVPLRLPVIQKATMLKYFAQRLQQTLYSSDTRLTEPEISRLINTLNNSVLYQDITPRDVNRYANTLSVVMPLLQGEANMADLVLLEALKTFFPAAYKLIAANQHAVTGATPESNLHDLRERYDPLFGDKASKLGNARTLVFRLFPKLMSLYTDYNFRLYDDYYRTEDDLYAAKSIASAYYFKRYFSYAVQDSEVPDKVFSDFLATIGTHDQEAAYQQAVAMIERAGEHEFLRLLAQNCSTIESAQAPSYCTLFVRLSDKFSSEVIGGHFILVSVPSLFLSYLLRAPEEQRLPLVQQAIQQGTLALAHNLVRAINATIQWGNSEEDAAIKTFFDTTHYQKIAEMFIARVLHELAGKPLYQEYTSKSSFFFSILQAARGQQSVDDYVHTIFAQHPHELTVLLRYMSPHGFSGSEEYYGHLDASIYADIATLFDSSRLYQIARNLIGTAELLPYGKVQFGSPSDEQRLHEFIYLHDTSAQTTSTVREGTNDAQ
jgi:hypothetical protein